MQLDLSPEEGKLLRAQLTIRIDELTQELVRTEKYELQVALDRDIERLRAIDDRLGRALDTAA